MREEDFNQGSSRNEKRNDNENHYTVKKELRTNGKWGFKGEREIKIGHPF